MFRDDFRIWAKAHRIAMDMSGKKEAEAAALMVRWERLFEKFVRPVPTAEELKDATDHMVAFAPHTSWVLQFQAIKQHVERLRKAKRASELPPSNLSPATDALKAVFEKIGKESA